MNIQRRHDQNGLVSIMIASVLMVIMALITLGFTRLVQNEQRQAIDNQLSKQAFYAAESGINTAASDPAFPGVRKDDCDVSGYNNGSVETGNTDIVFTCLLIDPTPADLVYGNDSITTNRSKVVPINTSVAPEEIIFQWRDYNNSNVEIDCNANRDFDPVAANWNKMAIFKLDLIGIPQASPFTRDNLLANQFSAIFYPCNGVTGLDEVTFASGIGDGNVGKIVPVDCSNAGDYPCQIRITALPGAQREFYARFNSIYSELNVRITAEDVAGNKLLFSNAQAVVDSTGRANDVFHRLQARIPLVNNYMLPTSTIQTLDDVCKLYEVQASGVIDDCQ